MNIVEVDALSALRAQFPSSTGYFAACTVGLPMASTRDAILSDLATAPDVARYNRAVEASRAHFARLVSVASDRIAIGSQTSVQVSLLAASLPDGAEVLVPEHEFSSLVMPFVHAGRGIRVRTAPLSQLAAAITPTTALVAFSAVQSACGHVADIDAICAAAAVVGARTVCDATQAVGWMPVDAVRFDALLCHTYKWLCCPRGVSFLALSEDYARTLTPVQAGWYAGDDPWSSCYGGGAELATSARRFDVSPAWQAFVGAEPALRAFAEADMAELHAHATGLAARFRRALGIDQPDIASAIVTWLDPDGADLARLTAASLIASGRNGRARLAFHVFNDDADVDRAVAVLRR
ncbi:aminotransferase class V-fold PLP-dependent enzyme [Microbacterium sp. VKM Ac-2870]|uniref:aminotransferase class V-fold PLP-dependent enzyme n=1 Tax=Microbacterium sp. VKM Ac-2870 TaxID=2783825 RepID=UPI00188D484A|nr:aminotransferase class V-fold PLP-dependent enzyme [Microbacterium sp. VKM Ac-2870]MBF4560659.1 aminotransferase class V-fold PLP-dependent enzyme [Microbacterium sp. VKM Ac-2870]